MRFTLLALGAAAAVAVPLDAAGGKVDSSLAPCDMTTCADVTGQLQCIARLVGGDLSAVRTCITGSMSQVCACANCNALAALALGTICNGIGGGGGDDGGDGRRPGGM